MRIFVSVVVLLCVVLALGVAGETKKEVRKIEISGMHCDNCASKVEKALSAIRGVEKVSVNRKKGEALVTVAAQSLLKTETLVNAVAKAGYKAKSGTITATPTEQCDDDCKDGEHNEGEHKEKKKNGERDDAACCTMKEKH
jgi:copper chaperone CopZ